jgi:hypothetical protein
LLLTICDEFHPFSQKMEITSAIVDFFFKEKIGPLNFKSIYFWCALQDTVDYQRTLAREIEARIEAKCDALAGLFAMDERGLLLKLMDE